MAVIPVDFEVESARLYFLSFTHAGFHRGTGQTGHVRALYHIFWMGLWYYPPAIIAA